MSRLFQCISPIDNTVFVEREYFSEDQIDSCLHRAEGKKKHWRETSIVERIRICHDAVKYMVDHAGEIGLELTRQMGRPIRYTPGEITGGYRERALYMTDIAEKALGIIEIPPTDGFLRFIKKEALGTVLVLAPWNYPYLTAVNAVIPALMAGNCVVLKHATQTPLCAERMVASFRQAGLPDGVLQYIHVDHIQVGRILRDRRINFVCFTGSVEGGAAIETAMAGRFTGSGMELGGKDPAYVRSDADLSHAVSQLVDGAFFNSGQSCCGIERIYVDHRVYDDFLEAFIAQTQLYVLGDPRDSATTLGPVVRKSSKEFIVQQIEEAKASGAQNLIDLKRFAEDTETNCYMAPQVLVNVDHSMRIMKEETFGPVIGIMPVSSDQEALHLMNDSRYGLTASIWTQDVNCALQLGDQLETGTVYLNRCDYLDPALAWTGVKDSGRGCTLSSLGYQVLTQPKSFHFKTKL